MHKIKLLRRELFNTLVLGLAFRKIEIRDKDIQYDLFDPNKMIPGKFLSEMEKY